MKKLIYTLAFVLILQCIYLGGNIQNCSAQWQSDVRLTNNDSISYPYNFNNAWCVASSGSVVHVVWFDKRDGNYEIYYKRSTDAGVNWGTDTRLTSNSSDSRYPSVAVSGSIIHVVWYDNRDGNNEIYYKRSTDAGVSCVADTRLTNNTGNSRSPSVAVTGSVVHIAWEDNRNANYDIYYKRSSDGGISWGTDVRMTNNNSSYSESASITVSGSVVHVVWQDYRDDGNYEIYYKRSTNDGVSWGADTRLTNSTSNSSSPSVSVSGSVVHVAWQDYRDGDWEIYYKRSTNDGVSWGVDTRLTNNTSDSYSPSVAVSGSVVHVVWYDYRDGNYEIYYKRDPTGNPIGIQNISTETPSKYSLSQNYPNPFNPTTVISFQLSVAGQVVLKVYDVMGREVQTLVNESLKPGTY